MRDNSSPRWQPVVEDPPQQTRRWTMDVIVGGRLGAGAGIPEAPQTGALYARDGLNHEWVEVTHDGGFY